MHNSRLRFQLGGTDIVVGQQSRLNHDLEAFQTFLPQHRPVENVVRYVDSGILSLSVDCSVISEAVHSLGEFSQTSDRSFCDKILKKTESVCKPSVRPRGLGNRCILDPLEKPRSIRLPSSTSATKSNSQDEEGETLSDFGRALLGSATMVSQNPRVSKRATSLPKSLGRRSDSAKVQNTPRKPKDPKPTRMALLSTQLSALGASSRVVELVQKSLRKGSNRCYESHWEKWSSWCLDNKCDPLCPKPIDLANFLAFLFFDAKLASATVKSIRSAICSTLNQIGGPRLSEDALIRDTIRGISLQASSMPRRIPQWDLFFVLNSLLYSPYEPLVKCNLKYLSFKTCFLIMLASGRRASEIHGLGGRNEDVLRLEDGSLSLAFLPEFLAKNQMPGSPSPRILIKPLAPFSGHDAPESLLCPVRALLRYRKFTKSLRISQRRLFLSHNPHYLKDISKTTVSRWVRTVIKEAYASADLKSKVNARPHEVRAWASSLAFQENWRLDEVLQAAFWRSKNSFTLYYMRDCSATTEDGTQKLACVAACTVVRGQQ